MTSITLLWLHYLYLLTDFTHCSGDSFIGFEQDNAARDVIYFQVPSRARE